MPEVSLTLVPLKLCRARDTVGTFEMAIELVKHGLITCVHKHYTVAEVGWL